MSSAYFVPVDSDTFRPTVHAGGAWSDRELHFSPVAGLVTHHLEETRARHTDPSKLVSRLTFDILGQLSGDEIHVTTRLVRPGRTIELWETVAEMGGRPVITLRAWAMSAGDTTTVAGTPWEPLPHPDGLPERDIDQLWPGGFIRSVRTVTPPLDNAEKGLVGRGRAWLTTSHALVDGVSSSALARFMTLVDTANGIAARQDARDWMFPNLDLTVHLFRQPMGDWVGFDTTVSYGSTGQGLTSTVLHDIKGPVGSAGQTLTVRPQPASA